jgi:hypothetical protein
MEHGTRVEHPAPSDLQGESCSYMDGAPLTTSQIVLLFVLVAVLATTLGVVTAFLISEA